MIKIPPKLQANDTVAVVAPASRVEEKEIEKAIETLHSWGLNVIFAPHLFAVHHQFAGTSQQRLESMQKMLDDANVKAVFCARGGYGSLQFLDRLNFDTFSLNPKWVIGFSDITAILCKIRQLGVASLHAPMLTSFSKITTESIKNLQAILFENTLNYKVKILPQNIKKTIKLEQKELIGGNVCLLHNQIGTATDLNTDGKILFLEEVGEPLYNLERMLLHLDRAGKFKNLAGLLVGQFSRTKPEEPPFGGTEYGILEAIVAKYGFPVCYEFPVGHEAQNFPMIFGGRCNLEITENYVVLQQNT